MIIGIEIRADALRAVAFRRFAEDRPPECELEVPINPPLARPPDAADRLSEPLGRLMDDVGRGRHSAAVAVPSSWCFCRVVSFPFRSGSRVEKTLHYSLEGRVPGAIEDYVVEPLGGIAPTGSGGARMLVSACRKQDLRSVLDGLRAAGIDPCVVQPALVAGTRPLWDESPDATWLIRLDGDQCEAVLVREGRPLTCHVQWVGDVGRGGDGLREVCERIRRGLRSAQLANGEGNSGQILLSAAGDSAQALAGPLEECMGMPVSVLTDDRWMVPRRLAQVAAKERETAVNLRRGELAYKAFARQVERRAAVALALAVLMVCLLGVYTVREMLTARRALARTRRRQQEVMSGVGPEVSSYARLEAAVTRARIEAAAAERAMTVSCLERWSDLVSALPQDADVSFELLDVNQQRIRLKATSPPQVDLDRILRSAEGFRPSGEIDTTMLESGRARVDVTLQYR